MKEAIKILAVIPARGGSKRLPRKNVLELSGKPLLSWTIDAAKQSKYIDKIIVSSDDDEVLDIAIKSDVDALQRPDALATDFSTTFDVVEHVIQQVSEPYDYIVLLQPTSPLRCASHIDEAIEKLIDNQVDAVISVCEMEHSPLWSNTLPEGGSMEHFLPKEIHNKRSQDLSTYYRLNGAIYICKTDRLLNEKTFYIQSKVNAYVMDSFLSIDIDTSIDFQLARCILESKQREIN